MNPGPRRATFRLPEPVEPANPLWQGRWYQLVVDALNHIDECIDEWKQQQVEQQVEMSAWMTATRESDTSFEQRLKQHLDEHILLDATSKAQKKVWVFQWALLTDIAKVISGVGLASAFWAGIQLLLMG